VDLRYRGQWRSLSAELEAPVAGALAPAVGRFHAEHARRYGYARPGAPVEIHALRVSATGAMARPPLRALVAGSTRVRPSSRRADVWFRSGPLDALILDRAALAPGDAIEGPALIEQMDTTTVVPPGTRAETDDHHNLRISPC
jgi:N-methylhydantoinase A